MPSPETVGATGVKPVIKAVLFDAYGTLFDIHAPAAALAKQLGPVAHDVSRLWRQKQLEYTWTLSLRGRYRCFWDLTAEALDVALATHGLKQNRQQRNELLASYRHLVAYPEVHGLLQTLRQAGIRTALLSNGDPDLLAELTASAGLTDLLDAAISVASLGIYKPDQRVYRHGLDRLGLQTPHGCAFVSSNAWDAAGAVQFGLNVFWVNRSNQPLEYKLDQTTTILSDLTPLAGLITAR
ncbi:MAG: haloacid dehalogenase type II [Dongiaceae bacterium]